MNSDPVFGGDIGSEGNRPYPFTIRLLHWVMAITILGLIALGWYMSPWREDRPDISENLYFWHKSFGMLMLFAGLARIATRWNAPISPLPSSLLPWEKKAASISHKLLYVLMILVPIAGYIDSSAYKFSSGVHFFFIDLPQLVPDNEMIQKAGNYFHKLLAYTLLALVFVHAAGAIKHRFFDPDKRNDVFPRISLRAGDWKFWQDCQK